MRNEALTGTLIDDRIELTITEICYACSCSTEWVIELVDEGVLEPIAGKRDDLRFAGTSLRRARAARRLQQDLGLNLPGVALALQMMDEMDALRSELEQIAGRRQP